MTFLLALRACELLLAFAFAQQSLEHVRRGPARWLHRVRLPLAFVLGAGVATPWVLAVLCVLALCALLRFDGPYNGGSDRLGMLLLLGLTAARWAPTPFWAEVAFGYLALQLVLSYFVAGWVKVVQPAWRSGRALRDVFAFSAYPASESLRGWQHWPRLLWAAAWAVMLLELLFPLALLARPALWAALACTAAFHVANAWLFGLNRFVWVWLAAYPALLWLQARLPLPAF